MVPVVRPDPYFGTANIMKKTIIELDRKKRSRFSEQYDKYPGSIDSSISRTEAEIDALVFKIYNLDESEISAVLNERKFRMPI